MAKTIGELSDEILELKLVEDKLRKSADAVKDKRREVERLLAEEAAAQGLTKGGGESSSFRVEQVTIPHVFDWDKFYEFIHKKRWYHLLERRPTSKAAQELWERGTDIPGVDKFTQIKVYVKGE